MFFDRPLTITEIGKRYRLEPDVVLEIRRSIGLFQLVGVMLGMAAGTGLTLLALALFNML